MEQPLVSVVGGTKVYWRRPALDAMDLVVPRGSIVGLLGPNGAGKTTLFRCLLGLLRPTSGRFEILGENAWDLSAQAKARLGYVPQKTALYPWMQVFELVDLTASFYPRWNESRVDGLLQEWKIDPEATFSDLSGGEAQKLAIALALGPEPELLILDEPALELDPHARMELLGLLREFVQDGRRSVLFSTHILSDVERVADRVAILIGGKPHYDGTVADLLAQGRAALGNPTAGLEDVYLHVARP